MHIPVPTFTPPPILTPRGGICPPEPCPARHSQSINSVNSTSLLNPLPCLMSRVKGGTQEGMGIPGLVAEIYSSSWSGSELRRAAQ